VPLGEARLGRICFDERSEVDIDLTLSPNFHPPMSRVPISFEPIGSVEQRGGARNAAGHSRFVHQIFERSYVDFANISSTGSCRTERFWSYE
jgi:hypothetical protein